jgi:tetratricopeptide (TPR) repeat protein
MVDQNHMISVIEENKRLSQSMLWKLQRKFFSRQGINSWSKEIVPQYITSNPYIAQAYARMIFGWLRDVADSLDTTQPVYIVELGAGSGRLAYHFLKVFFDFFDKSVLRDIPITYVLTDYSRTTRQFWKQHKQLQPWVESGRLDFAKFDAEKDETIVLINQGDTLSADTLKNPLVLIANYFFDGLTQDVFQIDNGMLYESLITLTVPESKPDLNDPNLLEQIKITYEHRSITSDYYDDSEFNSLLETYQSTLSQTHLLFPIGSLECLRRLRHLSNDRLLLLTGDKGYHHESELLARGEPKLAIHGSFSMKVNYHALGNYIQLQDGQFLSTPHHHANLDICVALLGQYPHDYPETRHAYHQEIVSSNPDDFYTLKSAIDQQDQAFDVSQFLAFLRLSGWDSTVFLDYSPILLHSLDGLSANIREGLYLAAIQVWKMYYHIDEERDLPFALGRLLFGLGYYTEASEFLHQSLLLYGSDATVLCNLAMCHYELNQLDMALDFADRSLLIAPQFEPARRLKIKISG